MTGRSARAGMIVAVAGAAAIAALAGSRPAHACSCAPPRAPLEAAANAAAVFEGRTFGVTREGGQNRFTFEVLRVWKGELPSAVEIYTSSQSAACGRAFEAGLPYLVYAHELPGGVLGDGLCSRTRPVANAAEDLEVLGAGRSPARESANAGTADAPPVEPPRIEPVAQQTAHGPNKRGCAIAGAPGIATITMLSLLGCARRRTRRGAKR